MDKRSSVALDVARAAAEFIAQGEVTYNPSGEGSVDYYACCHEVSYRKHAQDCKWWALKQKVDAFNKVKA